MRVSARVSNVHDKTSKIDENSLFIQYKLSCISFDHNDVNDVTILRATRLRCIIIT